MIRFGINGKDLVYGFGAVINKYKIDYSYESFSAVPTGFAGHRLSFSMDFGKTTGLWNSMRKSSRLG